MRIGERLRRLDDRFFPNPNTEVSWRSNAKVLLGTVAVSMVVLTVLLTLTDQTPEPIAFECALPAQSVVEDVLDVTLEAAGRAGATQYWQANGGRVLMVTCTGGTAVEQGEDTPGYVQGVPPFVVSGTEAEGYTSIRFEYQNGVVVLETTDSVDEQGARKLVDSTVEQIDFFSR